MAKSFVKQEFVLIFAETKDFGTDPDGTASGVFFVFRTWEHRACFQDIGTKGHIFLFRQRNIGTYFFNHSKKKRR